MSRSIEDLLLWGEYCGAVHPRLDLICDRNEHQEDTPHKNWDSGIEWDDDESGTERDRPAY